MNKPVDAVQKQAKDTPHDQYMIDDQDAHSMARGLAAMIVTRQDRARGPYGRLRRLRRSIALPTRMATS